MNESYKIVMHSHDDNANNRTCAKDSMIVAFL